MDSWRRKGRKEISVVSPGLRACEIQSRSNLIAVWFAQLFTRFQVSIKIVDKIKFLARKPVDNSTHGADTKQDARGKFPLAPIHET